MKKKLEYHKYNSYKQKYQGIVNRISNVRLVMFFVMLFSFILKYYYYPFILNIIFIFSLTSFIILVIVHDRYYKLYDYYSRCVDVILGYVDRENGNWTKFIDDGSDFLDDDSYYYKDLDIFGKCSLYQYLSVCKTNGGRKRLRDKLSNKEISRNRLKEEQDAIEEISNKIPFIISFCSLISVYDGKDISLSDDFSFNKKETVGSKYFIIGIFCSLFSFILLFCSLFGFINIYYFYGMFLFNYFISIMFAYFFKDEFSFIERMVNDYRDVYLIFKRCINEEFYSSKLKKIREDMNNSLVCGNFLKKLDGFYSLRSNIISGFLLNGLFCINLILIFISSYFISKNLEGLKKGVSDIEELESLCSLANVSICFDVKCMPDIVDDVSIDGVDMFHPLIGNSCVPNSFSSKNGINIITGSNMGGKTSFLRTLGINIILMNSGSFVCAKKFSACYFKIFTSMRVSDDISRGISTFYGELLRIKDMIEYVDCGNMLVLIDEIFKGTNYQDRIYGAKEVIKRLTTDRTIVLLTTHDFELCEEENICNYYVKEEYVDNQIVFDYKIRKGKCVSTNARYLMKKLGIILK